MKYVNDYIKVGLNALLRKSLYNPMELPQPPSSYKKLENADIDVVILNTADGVAPIAWHKEADPGRHTYVYFHGNTDNMGVDYRVDKYAEIVNSGYGLLALGYRGFDVEYASAITEDGLYHDARAALQFLLEGCDIPMHHLILFGESLGSGVAVQMATENAGLGGVILDCPYPSIPHEIKYRHPYIPSFVLGYVEDRFDSIEKISGITMPLLFIHATSDTVIPLAHGRKLHDAAKDPKYFIEVNEGAEHVAYPLGIFQGMVSTFSQEHAVPIKETQKTVPAQEEKVQEAIPTQKKRIASLKNMVNLLLF